MHRMPTVKVRDGDGWRCFQCNARVGDDETVCPNCGREFRKLEPGARRPDRRLGERVHAAAAVQRRSYRLTLIVLLAAVVILVVLFRPRRVEKPVLDRPASPRPEFQVVETWDLVQKGLDRMSVVALVPKLTGDSLLRDVLDWVLYETLDRYNRQGERYLRVVWAYLVEDSLASKTDWRAMAIWTDPRLDESKRPAGIGRDAVKEGPVEYDFTNNYRPGSPGTGE
jgi:hypothetical protein